MTKKMTSLDSMPVAPASWASAGIVDARAFRVGEASAVHALTHASPNMVRGICGLVANVVERDNRLASWAGIDPTCTTCQSKGA